MLSSRVQGQKTPLGLFLVIRNDSKVSDRQVWANSADPDQTASIPIGAVPSVSALFAILSAHFG